MTQPDLARLEGLVERLRAQARFQSIAYCNLGKQVAPDDTPQGQAATEIEALLARVRELEKVSAASVPFRVEAVAHLDALERYRAHRHGEPDTTEKMLRAALNVIRDMDNAALALNKENPDADR